jgi:crotonobetaine/carnitine-CoA ligase
MVFDSRIPSHEKCVLPYQLEYWASERPDQTAIIFHSGESWTWAETLEMTRRTAHSLQQLGVGKGHHVLSWQPNNKEALLTWFGLNYLGAVYVPINTAYKGSLLEHIIQLSDSRLMICHADLAPRLAAIDCGILSDVLVTGVEAMADTIALKKFIVHPAAMLTGADSLTAIPNSVDPWDTQYIIFTSGTTGPSKAVLSSYLQGYSMGPEAHPSVNGSDRTLVNMPLFHAGGTIYVIMTLANGGSCFIDSHFKTSEFWQTVRDYEITYTCLVAAMVLFLLKLPVSDHDKKHPLKKALCVPWNEDGRAVGERYGIELRTCFNMTEISSPLVSEPFPAKSGTCGQLRSGVEGRVVDEHDCEVALGVTGELVLRTDRPWSMNHGYYKNPEASAAAWRNGWFHTGDGFKRDEDGYFYFVDRIKDSIRRRGENISSFEVENEVTAFPSVREAAAVAVASEFGEDEVLVVVSVVKGQSVDPLALFQFLEPRMAHFMLPKFIRVIDELPKTPTQKIKKHLLKEEGVTNDTWDRQVAGINVKRGKIGS